MALTDIFTPSIVFSLAISLLFVGLLAIYVLQKISQQNHKISSMVDLISTFSNEQAMLRNYIQASQAPQAPQASQASQASQSSQASPVINDDKILTVGGDSSRSISLKTTENIITVSDNETNNTDDASTDNDDDDDDDEDSEDHDDDSDKDEDDSDKDEDDSDKDDDDSDKDEDDSDKDEDDKDEDDKEDVEIAPFDELEELEISKTDTNNTDFSELEIVADVETDNIKVLNIDIDMSFEKQNDHGEEDVTMDYKKASVSTLRSIAVKRGLVTADDSMRIKKADLVKLLETV